MSLAVGLVHDGQVWIGADAYIQQNSVSLAKQEPKVIRLTEEDTGRPVLIASVGDGILNQIVRFDITVKARREGVDIFAHMLEAVGRPLLNAINSHAENLHLKKSKWPSGRFLIGYDGHLFSIDTHFYMVEPTSGCCAIGAGEEFAFGALSATKQGHSPYARVHLALEAGAEYSNVVCKPFCIEKL